MIWRGGPRGLDKPLDTPFITIERREDSGRWTPVTDDLGMEIVWSVGDSGEHRVAWLRRAAGTYRYVITATRYRLVSQPFAARG